MAEVGGMRLALLVAMCGVALTSCSAPPAGPEPAVEVTAIVVPPPTNRTDGDLPVQGDWALDRLLGRSPLGVGEVLQAESVRILRARGIAARTDPEGETPVLRFSLERWEPGPAPTAFVRVTVRAALVEERTGRVLWEAKRRNWLVDTRGQPSLAAANVEAARRVAEEFLAGFRPPGR